MLTEALQPVQVAVLITPQPEHSVAGGQGGEVLLQILHLLVACIAQRKEALVAAPGQGQVRFRIVHGMKAGRPDPHW